MYEPSTNERCSITAANIYAAYNQNLALKIAITQEEVYLSSSTTNAEIYLSETLKSYDTTSNKDMPRKRSTTMMAPSKTHNYHIREIIYNIYKYNVFKNKK